MNKISVEVANWNWREWFSIVTNISFGRIIQGKARNKLQIELAQLYPDSKVVLLNSARAGLAISLQVFKERKPLKNEVIIPDFICDSVPNVIKECGLIPVYAPVGEDLNLNINLVDGICTENTLAVILPHMYAKPAQIEQAELSLAKKGVYLIDDAAQVAGIHVNAKPLGSFGDVGLLSFAQAKTIVTGVRASGGVLFVNNKELIASVDLFSKYLKPSRGRMSALQHFLFTYKWHGYTKKLDYYLQRVSQKIFSNTQVDYYSPMTKISNIDADLAIVQFSTLTKRINQAKELVLRYHSALELNKHFSLVQVDKDDLYLTRLIIQSKKITPKECHERLTKQGIMTKFVYGLGSRPYDGSYASGLLELPLQNLNSVQVDRVISALDILNNTNSSN